MISIKAIPGLEMKLKAESIEMFLKIINNYV
jgi:hypothetical protein